MNKRTLKNGSLLGDTMMISFTKVLNMIITLVCTMLLARFRSLQEYGTFSEIRTVVSLATAVFMMGLPRSLNYFIAKADNIEERDRFISLYYILATLLSVVVGIVLLCGRNLIAGYYDNPMVTAFWYVLLVLPWAQTITEGVGNMLVATKRSRRLVVYNISRSIAFLLIIIIIQVLGEDFYSYMLVYMITDAIFSIIVYIEAFKIVDKVYFKIEKERIKELLVFSIPIGISSALSTLDVELDHLMIGHFFDTEVLAVYSNAAKELPFTFIATSFTAVLLPKMTRLFKKGENDAAVKVWSLAVEFNAYILFFCACCCIVFAPQIMTILYSEKYLDGVPAFRFYALVLMVRITYFGMILNSNGKTKSILVSTVCGLLLNVSLNYLFIHIMGMSGAALATFISLVVVCIVQLIFSSKLIETDFKHIMPWDKLLIIVLKNLLVAFPAIAIMNIFNIGTSDRDIIISIGIGAACVLVYFLINIKTIKRLLRQFSEVENE